MAEHYIINRLIWKDSTSYSQGQKERIPTSWTAKTESLSITITKGHIYHKGEWVMHCFDVCMDTVPMKIPADTHPEMAQVEAIKMVHQRLDILYSSLLT